MKERILTAIRHVKREQWMIGIILGALILVIAAPVKDEKSTDDVPVERQSEDVPVAENLAKVYERQLEEMLALVEGVGKVKAAVTIESSGSKVVEKDIPTSSEKSTQKDGEGSENSSESVTSDESTVYAETESGEQVPYVISEIYPEIRGVVVVAEGGSDPVVVQQVQEAVIALFHVDAHKIKVLKMK